jgi:hypothetical protein
MRLIVCFDDKLVGEREPGTGVFIADYPNASKAVEKLSLILSLDKACGEHVRQWLEAAKVGASLIVEMIGYDDAQIFVTDPVAGAITHLKRIVQTVFETQQVVPSPKTPGRKPKRKGKP